MARPAKKPTKNPAKTGQDAPGLAARLAAASIVEGVLRQRRGLDELLDEAHAGGSALAALEERDRALARALVGIVLRRLGTLRHLIGLFVERGLPANAPRVETALLLGAAQILFLDVPDHAAVDLSVRLAQADKTASHFTGLVNAVLRRVAREGKERLATFDAPVFDTPEWLYLRWSKTYGAAAAHDIAAANAREPALDITVKSDAAAWAEKLGGQVLPTGTVRTVAHGTVTALPGFAEGAWWVQDAAAALPARLLGDIAGLRVADLCAAPGGKTAQLAAAGARVTAIDRSATRLNRVADNLRRLSLDAELLCADVEKWTPDEPFDAVLLDAPCSATGTIRRHPDVPWLKREVDIASLAAMQRRLIDRAVAFARPGGTVVYCTCSLEPEEGEGVVSSLLERAAGVRRLPVTAGDVSGQSQLITRDGDLRTLPCHLPDADSRYGGLDGFYAARLEKPAKP